MTLPIAEKNWNGKIEGISQEGLGIGTIHAMHEGKQLRRPLFIPFTAPKDEIEAIIIEQKRKYAFGEIKTILKPSPLRATPPCPHFTTCGGCNLQHIDYEEQLRQKAQQIQFLLRRKGIRLPQDITVLPTKQRHNYRWRAKVALEFTGGKINAGFRKFHTHEIIPVKTCFIVAPQIMELITLLNKSQSRIGSHGIFTQEIIVVVGENKKLGILVALDDIAPSERKQVKDFFDDLYSRNRKLIGNLFFEENRTTKTSGQVQEHITYKASNLTFSFLPETFIQSNVPTNEVLIAKALEFLFEDKPSESVVIDLYAGIGNISLPVAKHAKTVVAVEGHETSVLLARINSYQNNLNNTYVIHRSTEKYIHEYVKRVKTNKFDEEYPQADRIIIDPPRTGCTPSVIQSLLQSDAEKILYISCNPVTLAVDLAALEAKYDIRKIVGVDMFPDISHVETIVLLQRKER